MRRVALLAAAVALVLGWRSAFAVEPGEMLKNPVLEARAEAISQELRCLVCQDETIDESNAPLAHDLRVLLRQRLLAGDTNRQAIQFIVDRYGQFVLLKPRVEPATYVLWFGPAALLVVAAAGAFLFIRRRAGKAAEEEAPLSAEERRRVETLLRESG
jgi:cytochrome c-type biogenesis protein CcmH